MMFVSGLIVDLLVQHEFRGVKLISRRLENTKIEQKNTRIRHLIIKGNKDGARTKAR
jgi:hypothetical protein